MTAEMTMTDTVVYGMPVLWMTHPNLADKWVYEMAELTHPDQIQSYVDRVATKFKLKDQEVVMLVARYKSYIGEVKWNLLAKQFR